MRVLVVTNDYPPASGGIQRYIGDLLGHVSWEAHVAAPGTFEPQPGVVRFGDRLTPSRRAAAWITEVVREIQPDMLLYAAFPLALIGPSVARTTGVPYALIVHGAEVTIPSAVPILRARYARALHDASARLAVSRYTQERVQDRFGVSVTWIGAGVDVEVFRPDPIAHEGFTVGCVGRFVKRKGHQRVIDMAAQMRAGGIDARTIMVGWGPGERRLRKAARAAATEFVIDAPASELLDAYHRMDAFAMPVRSRWGGLEVEGLGLVYLEAAACGLPVIAGDSGGSPETVEAGVTGYVVRTDGELLDALTALALDPDSAGAMGRAGRARVERDYTWDAVVGRIQPVLDG